MGVKGLIGLCSRNLEGVQPVDLFAKGRNSADGIELLVDYTNFLFSIVEHVHKDIQKRNPEWQLIGYLGGQYEEIDRAVQHYIHRLVSNNVYPVFFADGAKGADRKLFEAKLQTWLGRLGTYVGYVKDVLGGLETRSPAIQENLKKADSSEIALLVYDQVKAAIDRSAGARFICSPTEADSDIARYLVNTPRAFAILGNDSDFAVMKDCKFIMDVKEAFDLDILLSDAKEFYVRVWTVHNTINVLGLREHKDLMDVCMLSGNDFTSPYRQQIIKMLGGGYLSITAVAQKYNQTFNRDVPLDQSDNLRPLLKNKPKLKEAIQLSYKMYNLEHLYELYSAHELTPLTRYILERTKKGALPRKALAWHNGYDYVTLMSEDIRTADSIQQWCDPLLSLLGAMCSDKPSINVYGRQEVPSGRVVQVKCPSIEWLPKLDVVGRQPIHQLKLLFDNIASMNEAPIGNTPTRAFHRFFEEFGIQVGFVLYAVNYLIQLHKKHSCAIGKWEIVAIVQTALRLNPENARARAFVPRWNKPTVRCVTLANWYQYTLQMLHCLAVFLQLVGFPEPKHCFSGTYFSSLYMTLSQSGPPEMDEEIKRALQSLGL